MKKPIIILAACAALISLSFFPARSGKEINVLIDAGHGGKDFGVTMGSLSEKDITLQICNLLAEDNHNPNLKLHFTRRTDETMPLSGRSDLARSLSPDAVISLHVDMNPNAVASHMALFVPRRDNAFHDASVQLADKFTSTFNLKTDDSAIKSEAPFHILNKSGAPALLIELGNLSLSTDRQRLTDPSQQAELATKLLRFLDTI